jgi:hypothetical protein
MTRRQPDPLTVAAAAQRGAQTVDPSGQDADVGAFVAHLEDDDEPVSAVAGLGDRLEEARRAADPEGDVPAVTMAAAVANYLAYRPDEASDSREDLLRLAARAEFDDGHPPAEVADWLAEQGVDA